jgi:esterase/lipase superfamily enzyme
MKEALGSRHVQLGGGNVIAYGHWGRPVLAFPSEQGPCWQYEERGMVDAVGSLLESGRIKLYCVDSWDAGTWQAHDAPLEERARRHGAYEAWIVDEVVPWISGEAGDTAEILLTGVSFGAYHAANFALKRADLFPIAICQSGVYDVSGVGWGERGDAVYFNNPMDYVIHLSGDHLAWLRERVSILLVCGTGQWEDTTGALDSTRRFSGLLAEKGLRHEIDVWGPEFPHDWPAWRAQLAHHLPRFC